MTQSIISSISVEALVAQRDLIISAYENTVEAVGEIGRTIAEANDRFPIVPGDNKRCLFELPAFLVTKSQYDRHGGADILRDRAKARESFIAMIDAGAWATLIDASGIRSFMSAQKRSAWDSAIHERTTAPFTKDYIESTVSDLMGNRVSMMEEGVIDVFRALSHGFKTNEPKMFGKKIIIDWLWTNHSSNWASLNSQTVDRLDDLMRVMSINDGQVAPDHRYGFYGHIMDADRKKETVFENEYMSLKWYKRAGTCHLTFKRLDLVEKLNLILAKHFPNAISSDLREKKTEKPKFSVSDEVSDKSIGPIVRRALSKASVKDVDGKWHVTMGMMDRAEYLEANTVLQTLGGKWRSGLKAHVFEVDPSLLIASVAERGSYLNPKDLGFFPTPDDLVKDMVQSAGLKPGMRVLEPSAGTGSIAKAAVAIVGQGNVDCVEYYPAHISTLESIVGDGNVVETDFLKQMPSAVYDVVLMNPPFSRNQDMQHVEHAWKFVKPGGTLVAIMATGWMNNQNTTAADFRKFTESVSDRVITPLERGIFKDTDVATVMLVLEKPFELAKAA